MRRVPRIGLLLLTGIVFGAEALMAQRGFGVSPAPRAAFAATSRSFGGYGGYYGGYGGLGFPYFAAPIAYQPPNYWWVSPYASEDPRQGGYNPSAGYEWDSIGALILTTYPAKARVTLDGIFVGTSDRLGPFQLPAGEHTLRLTAEGFEPSENIVKVEQPGPLFLDVQLQRSSVVPKPGPHP